ncbi:hypothetical protein LUZ61_015135 [Rhynchospora tenuis]|uniref:AAA+ ATPase domain-containing protein n=1 Tax=Rhynchospora tenuis TaxID=198213 RepID=A0AAD5Z3I0_9POAL|nr:hypothetical protein LUZ61_015135 [Rhynchospora tenuis]
MAFSSTSDVAITSNSSTKALIVSAATSAAASAFFLHQFVPASVQDQLLSTFNGLLSHLSNQVTIVVEESDGLSPNHMYKAAETYLASAVVPKASTSRRLRISVPYDDDDDDSIGDDPDRDEITSDSVLITIDRGEEVTDLYQGVKFLWRLATRETKGQSGFRFYDQGGPTEVKYYELTFHKRYRDFAIKSYLSHVLQQAKVIREETKTLRLWTNGADVIYNSAIWNSVKQRHPATFDKVAMAEDKKKALMDDLLHFVQRKDYYKRIGKAWKRGYLLYGPPGTGKSTLIAAMANFLRFDIYDLELTEVKSNTMLRTLLMTTTSRSILVIEDIDCSLDLQNRDKEKKRKARKEGVPKVTLSGLLNFVDGLWSSCGDERIIIFTTNYKEKLDPALLRPGRMDMHIHMGFCDSSAFRVLASNYHNLKDHPLFAEIDSLLETVEVAPAEVAEALMRSDNAEIALKGLIELLNNKKLEPHESKEDDALTSGEQDCEEEITEESSDSE